MKLLSPQQIHEWDAYTIQHEPVTSLDLMERAARACTDFIINGNFAEKRVCIFCGKGNNGGDGLAIARQLTEAGLPVIVYILEFGAKGTDDFQLNLHRLHHLNTAVHFIQSAEFFPVITQDDLVIDALFGSGLNRPLQDLSAALVAHLNAGNTTVIAVDVPSGMFIEKSSKNNAVVKAAHTLTFQSLKLCFVMPENAENFGEVHVLDISLNTGFPDMVNSDYALITKSIAAAQILPRSSFAHKGTYGHALLIAGNTGKMGAAILSAHACLRTGAGLVSVCTPQEQFLAVHAVLPEAMCLSSEASIAYEHYKGIGIGPGIGTTASSTGLVERTIAASDKPLVLDADALNILSKNKEWLDKLPRGSVLTPHPKEFERLFGESHNDFDRMLKAVELAQQYCCVIILKGHHTLVTANGKAWFNTTGNAGMAKGGSGDVLTGILTAFIAQGYDSLQAALCGVYLHGLAGDITAQAMAPESMLPTDLTKHISDAFLALQETGYRQSF